MTKILVVEDNVNILKNIRELLEISGFEVITETNGKDALLRIEKETPDLIISDVLMPGISGFHLKETLHNSPVYQKIPFIFISAKTELTDIRCGMNLGADDYLTKPFHHNDLIKTIKIRLQKQDSRPVLTKSAGKLPDELLKEKSELQKQVESLSNSERRVLKLLSQNFSSVEIGLKLFLSTKTVQNHRANMARKLNLSGQNSLLNFAIRCDLLFVDI